MPPARKSSADHEANLVGLLDPLVCHPLVALLLGHAQPTSVQIGNDVLDGTSGICIDARWGNRGTALERVADDSFKRM